MPRKKSAREKVAPPVTLTAQRSPVAESYRTLRTNITFAEVDRRLKLLLVTSPGAAEGKSTTCANLAVVMAQAGQEVLLVDADLRKPMLHKIFDLPNKKGLTNLLIGGAGLEELLQPTSQEKLHLLTSGPIPPNPAELLGSRQMGELLSDWRSRFDRVIIDTTPVGAVTDAVILSSLVDGVLLVINAGETPVQVATDSRERLLKANANIVGVVLNKIKLSTNGYYNYYYYSYRAEEK